MARTHLSALLLALAIATPLQAKTTSALNEIKAKIWEAQLV